MIPYLQTIDARNGKTQKTKQKMCQVIEMFSFDG